jgi:hypothetical protein
MRRAYVTFVVYWAVRMGLVASYHRLLASTVGFTVAAAFLTSTH